MNERLKILELLEAGKISAEQAAQLLSALDGKADEERNRREFPFGWTFPKKSTDEWRAMTSQIKSTVQQHLEEWKKNIDLDDWSFKSSPRIAATLEKSLPSSISMLTVENRNGRIFASTWDGDSIRILIRSYVKADNAEQARQSLDAAVNISLSHNRGDVTIQPNREIGEANLEVFLPANAKGIRLLTHNGSIRVEHATLEEMTLDTQNGGIIVYQTRVERMRMQAHHGNVNLQQSIHPICKSVYATTHHGTIDIDGIEPGVQVSGTAKSHHGRIDIIGDKLAVDYDNPQQRQHARFRGMGEVEATQVDTQIYCESNHGLVIVRA